MVQGVRENFDIRQSSEKWKEGENRHFKFVFIGKGLDADVFEQSLREKLGLK